MRFLTMCLATFSALVCAGGIGVLFVLPPRVPLTISRAGGSLPVEMQSLSMLALLTLGLASGTAMLVNSKRRGVPTLSRTTEILTVVAAAMSIYDFVVARYVSLLGPHNVPWLNIVVLLAAVLFWVNRRDARRNA
jgi:hypothetical protein